MIVRQAQPDDAPAMCDLLNRIITIGGTTAHQNPFTPEQVLHHYIQDALTAFVAVEDGRILGFQATDTNPDLPQGWGDIGTFVDPTLQRGGVGAALFDATSTAAKAKGLTTLNATIRADNAPGLGFYSRRGFVDYAQNPDWALKDGCIVGRVSKRFDLV
ncbi:GNAT family N-acetyltransferase [Neogemmobacter tilapiae]|uniref:GNAT family acetyltransferase n=1 Tax=Neogemmobacter tilapiae TaxID=875041 RepID=A0A918TLZ8_9RHOB|nr:GNAT family N-acetyltransferase [Gemmobacter tilapiae]GHC55232.1 GNAT family acetyltransferase [Gemmobacter tilapiae]